MEDNLKIRKIYEYDCCRCQNINRIADSPTNKDTPLINQVALSSLDIHGNIIPELEGENYYICDDCWNDLLDFFKEVSHENYETSNQIPMWIL